jgi:hypothetical protein
MTKQLLKGLSAASLVAVLAVVSVPAEAADLKCRVPFSFTVNQKTLPPGVYNLSTERSALLVRGSAGGGAITLTNNLEEVDKSGPRLVFHKYGDQYFLRQAWTGDGSGRALPEPRMERDMVRAARNGRLAVRFERVAIPVL